MMIRYPIWLSMVSASELVKISGATISASANRLQTTMRPRFKGLKR